MSDPRRIEACSLISHHRSGTSKPESSPPPDGSPGASSFRNFLNLVEFLNQPNDFYKLKDVELPGLNKVIPFF